jgi:hypothetical protein
MPSGSLHLQQQPQTSSAGSGFGTVASSASLLSLLQLSDEGTGAAAHTTRRLAMMVNDWRVSASAHLSVTHGHDTGATVSVQRKF